MLDDIRIFVKVVQLSGFSRAARLLKLPTSTVSRTVARLESDSGTKLLLRTTRSLKPTAAGLTFYESCLEHVQALEDAKQSLSGQDSMVTGLLRLTAPEDIGEHIISAVIGDLMRLHPGLSFEFNYTNNLVDLISEGFDLAVRLGTLRASSLVARRAGHVTLIVVAAPSYLEGKSAIKKPSDIRAHQCISFSSGALQRGWDLRAGAKKESIAIEAAVTGNQMTGLVSIALQSAGLAFVPSYLCQAHLNSGKLVRVLPDWSGTPVPVSIVSTQGTGKSLRHRIVADQLAAEIGKRL